MARPIILTVEQKYIFNLACIRLRESEQDNNISDGRCLELIAAEYLSGVHNARKNS